MKANIAVLSAAILLAGAYARASAPETSVYAALPVSVQKGKDITAVFTFDIPKGWHIYGQNAGEFGEPTKIEAKLPAGLRHISTKWPAEENFDFMGMKSSGYSGKIDVRMTFEADSSAKTGPVEIPVKISMVQCMDTCMPIEKNLKLKFFLQAPSPENLVAEPSAKQTLEAPGNATAETGFGKILSILAGAFFGGAILNLMPCVFPVIGIKILSFASGANDGYGKTLLNAAFYTAGIVVSFLALGAALVSLKHAGIQAGWGFQLQSPLFTACAALLFFAMGLSFAGAFEIGASIAGKATEATNAAWANANQNAWANALGGEKAPERRPADKKFAASFLSGVLAVLVASPCTAPFMGSAVGYVLTADVSNELTFSVFAALGLGMAAPYMALSAMPSLARAMPKPGAWMEVLKNIFSIPLFASAIWLVWVFDKQTNEAAALLSAILILAVGLRTFGMCSAPHRTAAARAFGFVAALAGAAAAVWISLEVSKMASESAETGLQNKSALVTEFENYGIKASEWSAEKLDSLRKSGKPVYVDFTAAWCITCQYNKMVLFSKAVTDALKKREVEVLVADWTNRNSAIKEELSKYGRAGVPLNVYFPPNGKQAVILPAILTEQAVLDAVDKSR